MWRVGHEADLSIDSPQLVEISRYDVTIKWETDRPVVGTVRYRSAGTEFQEAFDEQEKKKHELKIGGLQADTLYDYTLNDTDEKFSFKTAPGKSTAFRFMVHQKKDFFNSKDWTALGRGFNENLPDFIILLNEPSAGADAKAQFVRQSTISSKVYVQYADEMDHLKRFAFGNSAFLFIPAGISPEAVSAQIQNGKEEHFFLILPEPDPELLKRLQAIRNDAVLIYPGSDSGGDSNLILPLSEQMLIIDVDGTGIVANRIALDDFKSEIITVKETPDSVKRSCIYCRKLLEAKKYQASIDWYRDFIIKYQSDYIVDDAQFQIANIYDRYLYDYPAALTEYDRLLTQFPDSTKIKQARQRIEHINSYNDYGYEPLASFERTKSEIYKNDKTQAIQIIEGDLEKYPDAKLLNTMLFWLGHALAADDLDKSIAYHNQLLLNSSGREKKETLISMGDVCYLHKQYPNAIQAYTTALMTGEAKYNFGVQDKINKSTRNIKRGYFLNTALILLCIIYLGAVLIRPLFFTKSELLRTGLLLLVLLVVAYSAWWIYYQNYPEVAEFTPQLFLMLASSHLIALAYSRKVFSKSSVLVNYMLTPLTFTFLSMLLYYVFLYQRHYLPSLGL